MIGKLTDVPVPEGGAEPVPFQPVQTYLEVAPEMGDAMEEEAVEPASYHPSPVGLP
jgi:hypothetical protein